MKFYTLFAITLVLVVAVSSFGMEKKAYQLRDDFGTAPMYDCALQYYYYIPCPTYSWFWAYTGWTPGDIIGTCFHVGDQGTGGWQPCDPMNCHTLEIVRVLDFAGYGTIYPGLFTVSMDVYCADVNCCPQMPSLWNSGPIETHGGWNYIYVEPPVCLTPCWDGQDLSFVVTATMIGTQATYPAWGMDNISTALETGCVMHDIGCLPATYPRAFVHSGYYGNGGFQYCPPAAFPDGRDTTPDASQFGLIELAWRAYLVCSGPTPTESSTWGQIKRIYR